MAAVPPAARKPAAWRRWAAIVLRTAHLVAVVLTGAMVLGVPHAASGHGPAALFISGMLLFAFELADDRVRLTELAGAVVVGKLVLCAWMLADPLRAEALFWGLLVVSGVASHAPRWLRHWAPGRR
jgi:hypothetical protein